jgi:hypothetical protein
LLTTAIGEEPMIALDWSNGAPRLLAIATGAALVATTGCTNEDPTTTATDPKPVVVIGCDDIAGTEDDATTMP